MQALKVKSTATERVVLMEIRMTQYSHELKYVFRVLQVLFSIFMTSPLTVGSTLINIELRLVMMKWKERGALT